MTDHSILTATGPLPVRTVLDDRGPSHVLDLYGDLAAGEGPLVLLIHGEFWRAAYDRRHLRPLAAAVASSGAVVGLPEFRRVGEPGGGWPGTVEDVVDQVRRLRALIPARGPVALVGHSSGGHLAVLAALRCTADEVGRVVSLAGVLDLGAALREGLSDEAAAEFLGSAAAADADPLLEPVPSCPVVVVHGDADDQVDAWHSRRYAAKSSAVELVLLPEAGHYDVIDPACRAFASVRDAVLTWSSSPSRYSPSIR